MNPSHKKRTPEELEKNLLGKIRELEKHGFKCYLCGGKFGLGSDAPTRDHVLAKSDRKSYVKTGIKGERKSNLRWAHSKCNKEKGSLPLLQYLMNKAGIISQIGKMNLDNTKPTSTQFYWMESNFEAFLGPFKNQEEAIEVAKEWNSGNPQCCPDHDTIVLVYSREHPEHGWVWDYVYPKLNLTSCR